MEVYQIEKITTFKQKGVTGYKLHLYRTSKTEVKVTWTGDSMHKTSHTKFKFEPIKTKILKEIINPTYFEVYKDGETTESYYYDPSF